MKTIKIIDLLNKIANGEEVPKKIRFDNTYWYRICGEKNVFYISDDFYDLFIYFFRKNQTFTLNDEIEILEENKKIEKLCHCCMSSENQETQFLIQNINDLSDKMNELIDEVNKLKEKRNE